MNRYWHKSLADHVVRAELQAACTRSAQSDAELLGWIAEYDARQLYLVDAYSSMVRYCVEALGMSEDAALKRIRVARIARKFPPLFEAIAGQRLNLSAVGLLAKFLTLDSVDQWIDDAAGLSIADLRLLIAERFPQADIPLRIGRIAMDPEDLETEPLARDNDHTQVATNPVLSSDAISGEAMGPLPSHAAQASTHPVPRPRLAPLSPGRYALQLTISQETHDLLRAAQELLGHSIPSGDVAEVLHRALSQLVAREKKRKFGIGAKPRAGLKPTDPHTIPGEVRREVALRDGGQCTFTSARGRRCGCRTRLEFDHIVPRARGGEDTVDNLRLRCRAHNQYEAIRVFGGAFMEGKLERARQAREAQISEARLSTS